MQLEDNHTSYFLNNKQEHFYKAFLPLKNILCFSSAVNIVLQSTWPSCCLYFNKRSVLDHLISYYLMNCLVDIHFSASGLL